MINKKIEDITVEESCGCCEDVFEYNGTTYTIKMDNNCDELNENACNALNAKKIVTVGAGIVAASGILFFAFNKKKKTK